MKLLWVNSDFLHPATRGGQIRTLEMLKRLNQRHEIHYAALYRPGGGALERSSEYCSRAYPIPHHVPADFTPGFFRQLCEGAFSKLPVAILRYRSPALQRQVATLTRSETFDAIVCDFLTSAANIPDPGAAVLFQHNVESIIWKRHAEHGRTLLHRMFFRRQYERMLRYEQRVCRSVKRIVAVSEADARTMQALYGVRNVASVPTGVDIDCFMAPSFRELRVDLVFVGSMDWRPNIDGLGWFTEEVLPRIRRRCPECSLVIVGRNPSPEILRLAEADPYIRVTGTVADIRPFLWESAVSIVPLRIGGGTRLKIYEAMAARVPVVSTTVGAEGLDVRDGENIALADSPEGFAERCLALLADAEARRRQSEAAWEMVSACYSWETVACRFEQLLI
ncbi:MAG TPA: glycosyltransferase family 4 protein [Bryobacteraceae bacterium]|nr:glycosyltransferase family 4 protein [Bryobacteraceae bacterium]